MWKILQPALCAHGTCNHMDGGAERTLHNVNRLSYDPLHNYRTVDVDAWAEQWFGKLATMDTTSPEYQDIGSTIARQLGMNVDERATDANDLSYYMTQLRLLGKQNPYTADSQLVDERERYTEWGQRQARGMMVARQLVRNTLKDADSYATFRLEQEHAGTDYLTGVLNRRGLIQHLRDLFRLTADAQRQSATGEILGPIRLTHLYGDVNQLKWINDTLGHHVGDVVIAETASKTQGLFRRTEAPIIYREGGDEFGAIFANVSEAEADALTSRIIQRQVDKINSERYRQAMQTVTRKVNALKGNGHKMRTEVREYRPAATGTLAERDIRHILYIQGEPIIDLYDIVTFAVGAKSGYVNNLDDVEELRRGAESTMRGAKRVFQSMIGLPPE